MKLSVNRGVTVPNFPVEVAVRHICAQHRNLGRVLSALETQVRTARHTVPPSAGQVSSMLEYINRFCMVIHHPAEEQYLFPAMRLAGVPQQILNHATRAHEENAANFARLQDAFASPHWKSLSTIPRQVADYVVGEFNHMAYEENILLPEAVELLPATEWPRIAEAFLSQEDPLFGDAPRPEFELLRRFLQPVASTAEIAPGENAHRI